MQLLNEQTQSFVHKVITQLSTVNIDVSDLILDHFCWRCETSEEYASIKEELASSATLLVENYIGGRLIATYKLPKPIHYEDRKVDVLELASPKALNICSTHQEILQLQN